MASFPMTFFLLHAEANTVVTKGAPACLVDAYGQIREEGESEGFLDWLFGTNCYSKAVHALSHECRQLSQEEQSRLALELANCFLATRANALYLARADKK